jgi:YesN/AraC family two-component response regulator
MSQPPKTILVIEDDITTQSLYSEFLKEEGFETIASTNGMDGIEKVKKNLPDLVICDIIMPDTNGYDVLSALQEDPLTAIIPFIFLTGCDKKADLRRGMELGADDYLTKPLTVQDLIKAVNARLSKQILLQNWCANYSQQLLPPVSTDMIATNTTESIYPSCPQLKEVFDYIEANYDQGITLSDVAVAVGYSSAYLTHRVGKETGETVNGWIVKRRMSAARSLLKNTDYTIERIATSLGYQNSCHFSRQFRQHHGVPPQTWRKENYLQSAGVVSNMPTLELA